MTGSSEEPTGADPAAVERTVARISGAAVEENLKGTSPAERAASGPVVGCLWIAGAALVVAFFYFGFFAFALVDFWNDWRLIEPYVDERTSEILAVVYWPLIQLFEYLGLI
ncbi:MAG TPA: hypothetical protein VGN57_18485 [Pirellulaceae bacterium]|jgi:hypothetical protein|nr:hypothetical protein [Pirellulaceae bacterium]